MSVKTTIRVGFVFAVIGVLGWMMNAVKLTAAAQAPGVSEMELLRIAGVFLPPLGAVVGWF